MCLSCGHPFGAPGFPPTQAPTSTTSSPAIWWLTGVIVVLGLLTLGAVGLLILRSSGSSAPPPASADAAALEGGVAAPGAPTLAEVVDASTAGDAGPPKAAPLTEAERDELNGSYTCSMDDTPTFPCRIANGTLEKLAGSQRFRGPIRKVGGGNLEFSGTFFCPFGDCTHPVATTFIRQGPGRYVGKFGPNSIPGGGPGGERVVLTKVGH
jgi:hypothetical protein